MYRRPLPIEKYNTYPNPSRDVPKGVIKKLVEYTAARDNKLDDHTSKMPTYLISDYFMSQIRSLCYRSDERISPYEYFMANDQMFVDKASDSFIQLLDDIYSEVKGCGTFPIKNALYCYQRFQPKRVLDPCSGWGDRLIGSLIASHFNISPIELYTGVDPHEPLMFAYNRMIRELGVRGIRTNLVQKKFEDTNLTDLLPSDVNADNFDMILTSPPYSNLEIYSSDDSQSISPSATEFQWKVKFFYPMVLNSWDFLAPGGEMCLFLPKQEVSYVTDLIHFAQCLHQVDTFESMPAGGSTLYIWRKKTFDLPKTFETAIINEKDNIISMESGSIKDKVIKPYLQAVNASSYHYVSRGKDWIAKSIAEGKEPGTPLTIYLPSTAINYKEKFMNIPSVTVEIYSVDYRKQLDIVSKKIEFTQGVLLPEGLDSAEYQALLTQSLNNSLYDVYDKKIRIWISDTNLVLARSLLSSLPLATILLSIPHKNYDLTRIPKEDRLRLQIYHYANTTPLWVGDENVQRNLKDVRKDFGYKSDYILLS